MPVLAVARGASVGLDWLAHLAWPNRCAGCDALAPWRRVFCDVCVLSAEPLGPACVRCALPLVSGGGVAVSCGRCAFPFLSTRAAWLYEGSVTHALVRLKHAGRPDVARALAPTLAPMLAASINDGIDVIAPVPLHKRRLRARGFNQAIALVRPALAHVRLGGGTGARLIVDLLARMRDSPDMGHAGPAERAERVRDAFTVPRPARVRGQRVLLVDDVLTTGATASACTRALLDAGASLVRVLAFARVPKPGFEGARAIR